jgi:8-hydroxy-5-deazaflavin:NADPH oxidoreductase
MNVTIIGAGNMGRGIGTRLLSGGHTVTLVDREPDSAAVLAEQIASSAKNSAKVKTASFGDSIDDQVVILAVPYGATSSIIEQYGSKLAGKIVMDISNPLNSTYDGLAVPAGTSAAEEIAKEVPNGTKVVKAFNTIFAQTLESGEVDGKPLDVLIAGDDADAKSKVAKLVKDGGMRPIDTGPLSRARQLEGIGLLHITLQQTLNTNWKSTVKFLN